MASPDARGGGPGPSARRAGATGVRIWLLTALVMCAFAANSVLNRMALADGEAEPFAFGVLRLVAGALALSAICLASRRSLPVRERRRWVEAPALALYVFGFSLAYTRLDAGTGALILFAGVQVVMFSAAIPSRPPLRRWLGAGIALAGLTVLSGGLHGSGPGIALMSAAALGWGIYSISGRSAGDPLAATAANFVLAGGAALLLWPIFGESVELPSARGALLAILSGAVASGLGYALWYAVLPRLAPEAAGLAQLTVPVIAFAAGATLLGELPAAQALAACAVILGGVALGLLPQRRIGSSAS